MPTRINNINQVNKGIQVINNESPCSTHDQLIGSPYSSLPVEDILKIRMKDLSITNSDMQEALGYSTPNVIAMIRTGKMKLPASKANITARKLQIDPVFFLGKVITELDPLLWEVITEVLSGQLLTANELELVKFIRERLDGHDVNLVALPSFKNVVAGELSLIVTQQNTLAQAAMDRQNK